MFALALIITVFFGLTIGVFFSDRMLKAWRKFKRERYIARRIKDVAFDPGLVCDILRREDPEFDRIMQDIVDKAAGDYKPRKSKTSGTKKEE